MKNIKRLALLLMMLLLASGAASVLKQHAPYVPQSEEEARYWKHLEDMGTFLKACVVDMGNFHYVVSNDEPTDKYGAICSVELELDRDAVFTVDAPPKGWTVEVFPPEDADNKYQSIGWFTEHRASMIQPGEKLSGFNLRSDAKTSERALYSVASIVFEGTEPKQGRGRFGPILGPGKK